MRDHLLQWDRQALLWINSQHHPVLDAILYPVALLGEVGAVWLAVCLFLLISGGPERRRTGLKLLLTLLVVDRLIAAPIGFLFHRDRPYLSYDEVRQVGIAWKSSSFPSGHAHSVWLAAILLGARRRRFLPPLILFALLTCYSRPYLGMHYPIDVTAGSLIGITAGLAVLSLEALNRRRLEARARKKGPGLGDGAAPRRPDRKAEDGG